MYMAALGGTGIRALAQLNHDKAAYFKSAFQNAGLTIPFESPVFNEFVVKFPPGFKDTHRRLVEKKIVAGLPLTPYYPELEEHYLFCATETVTKEDMDTLIMEVTK
jgi:glycine dehydrogenase subunit 1